MVLPVPGAPVDNHHPVFSQKKIFPKVAMSTPITDYDVGSLVVRVGPCACIKGGVVDHYDWSYVPNSILTSHEVFLIEKTEKGLQAHQIRLERHLGKAIVIEGEAFKRFNDGWWARLDMAVSQECYTALDIEDTRELISANMRKMLRDGAVRQKPIRYAYNP